jgi:hypothetical protein
MICGGVRTENVVAGLSGETSETAAEQCQDTFANPFDPMTLDDASYQ